MLFWKMRETFCSILLVLILVLHLVIGSAGSLPSPSVGDIRMVPYAMEPGYYKLQLYYTDGIQQPGWRGLCSDHSFEQEVETICRQMGGCGEKPLFRSVNTDDPVWLENVNCNGDELHILRCGYSVVSDEGKNECTSKLIIKSDFSTPLVQDPYDGQLSLCPADAMLPASNNGTHYSVSFGVVSLYMKNTKTWRGLEQNSSNALLGCYEADTVCRQMGYTGAEPGSAVAISATTYKFNKCFDEDPPFLVQKGPWKITSEINCRNQSHNCFKSCYDYTTHTMCEKCEPNGLHTLVIKCNFDPTKMYQVAGGSGSREECEIGNSSGILGVAIGIPVSVVVAAICVIPLLIFCWRRKRKRTTYNKVEGDDSRDTGVKQTKI